jgi:hypothetical protein
MSKKITQEEVENRFIAVGLKPLEAYKGSGKKILAQCVKCQHEYSVEAGSVFQGYSCPKCARHVGKTQEEMEENFRERGLELLGRHKNMGTSVAARCLTCSYEWDAWPWGVLKGGSCPQCVSRRIAGKRRMTQEEVISRLNSKGLKPLEPYLRSHKPILVMGECGHTWKAALSNIGYPDRGSGCPYCADCGFNPGKPAVLYYLRVFNPYGDPLYKIGITNRTVEERFRYEIDKIAILRVEHFQIGSEAYDAEKKVLREFSEYLYTGRNILHERGNSELFTVDVLVLDGPHQTKWLVMEAA